MAEAKKVAVITGGATGLGYAMARALKARGDEIVLLDQNAVTVRRAGEELGAAATFRVDVTDENAVRETMGDIENGIGAIAILINSAGITGQTNMPSHEVEASDFERVWRINTLGCFLTSKAVLPQMIARGYGRILHIASISGKEGNAGMVSYSTSKAAVIALAKVQGKETAGSGVTVNALAPAVVRTEMVAALPPEQVKYMTDKIPMKRCGTLEEVAAMAAFIVSPENSFTTGFCFDLSGGRATY
jgi:3-oxoacyl-[acyl-carrier protein] reductase